MTVRREIAQSRFETGTRCPWTDTLPRVSIHNPKTIRQSIILIEARCLCRHFVGRPAFEYKGKPYQSLIHELLEKAANKAA